MIVPRREWFARNPWMALPLETPVQQVFIKVVNSDPCTTDARCSAAMRSIQNIHITTYHLPDIMFNFGIGGNGRIYEGRGWNACATLLKKHNYLTKTSLLVALLGGLQDRPYNVERIKKNMNTALEKLLKIGVKENYISPKFVQINMAGGLEYECTNAFRKNKKQNVKPIYPSSLAKKSSQLHWSKI